jgi:hypothetical protein
MGQNEDFRDEVFNGRQEAIDRNERDLKRLNRILITVCAVACFCFGYAKGRMDANSRCHVEAK